MGKFWDWESTKAIQNGALKSHHALLLRLNWSNAERIHVHVHPFVSTVQQIEIGRRRIAVHAIVLLVDLVLVNTVRLLLLMLLLLRLLLATCRWRKIRTAGAEKHAELALLHVLLETQVRLVELIGNAGRIVAVHTLNGVRFVLDGGGLLMMLGLLLLLVLLIRQVIGRHVRVEIGLLNAPRLEIKECARRRLAGR